MLHAFSRTELLLGTAALAVLADSTVAVFGVGGVGSYSVEALARSGVGTLVLVDDDDICLTNINRQLQATLDTIGRPKVEVLTERIARINPKATVKALYARYAPKTRNELLSTNYDYVIDAIDMIGDKIDLICSCAGLGIPLISCMGVGNKLDPTRLEVADLYETTICPLARVMRKELRKRDIKQLSVVYSREVPLPPRATDATCADNCICPNKATAKCLHKGQIPGSTAFVPAAAGLILAAEVVRALSKVQLTASKEL